MIVAMLLALAIQAAPSPPPPRPPMARNFDGKFSVVLIQPHCIRAPCPPMGYRITLPDRTSFAVKKIEVDPASPAQKGAAAPRFGITEAAVDGRISVDGAGGSPVARLYARRIIAGEWKP